MARWSHFICAGLVPIWWRQPGVGGMSWRIGRLSAAEWLGIGLLCFAVGQLAERSRRHHRRHRMRLVSWRWDQIAAYQRKQSKLAKMGLRLAKPIGELA